jgi:hypothetical protein
LALVAVTCRGCGVIGVYWNGRLIRRVSLNATATHYQQVLTIIDFGSVKAGTLVLKNLNSGRVYIDGLVASRA